MCIKHDWKIEMKLIEKSKKLTEKVGEIHPTNVTPGMVGDNIEGFTVYDTDENQLIGEAFAKGLIFSKF